MIKYNQTLDLDTRGYVFERGLDADAEAQQNQRLQWLFKKRKENNLTDRRAPRTMRIWHEHSAGTECFFEYAQRRLSVFCLQCALAAVMC